MKIVIDDRIPFIRGVFEPYADVLYVPGGAIDAPMVREASALIVRTRTRCDAGLLAGSAVRAVATATIGYDHLDGEYLDDYGIRWSNAPGCNSSSVAQYVVSVLVSLPLDLHGVTVGIIGHGHVGRKVAAAVRALGARVLLNDPPKSDAGETGYVDLPELLEESDVVTMHVPLESGGRHPTMHMVNRDFISAMKTGSVFINASRGPVADTGSLISAVESGRMAHCVCDVWENEPDIDRRLLGLCRYATPHVAGYSADGKANGTANSVRFVASVLGLDELIGWFPASVPGPEQPEIDLSRCHDRSEAIRKAVLASYDVEIDDMMLRRTPGSFEKLRGEYRMRREFPAFSVAGAGEAAETLSALGFSVC